MKYIKNLIFSTITLLFFLLSGNLNAFEEAAIPENIEHEEVSCGIGEQADAESEDFLYVIPNNSSICEEDISFKMLYMLFGESLDSEFSQSIINLVHEPKTSDKAISQMSDVGKSIQAIYSSLTIILFTLITLLISYNTINFIYKTQTSGEFMGQKRGRAVNVGIQSLIIIILVTPVGSMLIIQVLLLALAILGIKMANFFLSNFLNTIDVKTSEINYSSNLNFASASANTESMINANLCEIRSNQQIWQNNLRESTSYTEGVFFDLSTEEFRERVNVCNAYTYEMKYNDDTFVGFTSAKTDPVMCKSVSTLKYHSDEYGYSYNCYDVNYSFVASEQDIIKDQMQNQELKDKGDEIIDYYEEPFDPNPYKAQFNVKDTFNNIIPSLMGSVNSLMSNPDYEKEDLIEIFDEHTERFYDSYIKDNNLLKIDNSIIENPDNFKNKDIANFVYLSNLIALNYMYGAYFYEDRMDESTSTFDVGFPDDPLKLFEDPIVGYDEINNMLTKKASSLALNYHCVNLIKEDINIENDASIVYKSKDAVNVFNGTGDVADNLKSNYSYECINSILQLNGSNDIDEVDSKFFNYFDDLDIFGLGEYNFDEADLFSKENLVKGEYIIDDSNKNIIKNQLNKTAKGYDLYKNLSIGYFYITKAAIAKNVAKQLKTASDNKVLVETRKKGWAGLGSMLIAISSEQTNAMGMISDITNSFSVSNYLSPVSNSAMANTDAFIDEDEPSILNENNRLLSLGIQSLHKNGIQTIANMSNVDSEDSTTLLSMVVNSIIEFMFENPLLYLKDTVGMAADKDIVSGLEECSQEGHDCVPNSTHPINGLMLFGQELMFNVILILVITFLVNILADAIAYANGKDGKKDDSSGIKQFLKGFKFLGPLAAIIMLVLEIILTAMAMILNTIKPFMYILLLVSIIIGYLMPLIPYLMTAMIVFSWFISFFVVSIALPISLLIMGRLKEDGSTGFSPKAIWEMAGNILLKPSLATIAIIFAWSLVSVSIYYINSTIFYIISSTTGNFFISLISTLFMYVIYLFVLYYVINHSLKIIIKFSDEVAQTLGISGSSDKNDFDSTGFENFVIAQQIQGGLRKTEGQADQYRKEKTNEFFKRKGVSYETSDRMGNAAGNLQEKTNEFKQNAGEKTKEFKNNVGNIKRSLVDKIKNKKNDE